MRKTWQAIVAVGIVLGIVVSLVTLIEFVSGQSSLPGLISGSRPTSVSSSPSPTPTPASTSPTPMLTVSTSGSFFAVLVLAVLIILTPLSFMIVFSAAESMKKWTSCSRSMVGIFLFFGVGLFLPMILTGLAAQWLATMAIVPLYTVLLSYLMIWIISLLSAYLVKRWSMSLK